GEVRDVVVGELERGPDPGVPAAQGCGLEPVVLVEEVVDRVLLAARAPVAASRSERVGPPGVREGRGAPRGRVERARCGGLDHPSRVGARPAPTCRLWTAARGRPGTPTLEP